MKRHRRTSGEPGRWQAADGRRKAAGSKRQAASGKRQAAGGGRRARLLDGDEPIGLHDRIDDCLTVERPERADVDHLARHAERLERRGRLEARVHTPRVRHERHVGARLLDLALADLHGVVQALNLCQRWGWTVMRAEWAGRGRTLAAPGE